MELLVIVKYVDISEASLFDYGYRVKDDLLDVDGVNYVFMEGARLRY